MAKRGALDSLRALTAGMRRRWFGVFVAPHRRGRLGDYATMWRGVLVAVFLVAAVAFAARDDGSIPGVEGFPATIAAAVARMHAAMDVTLSGDPDRDFARMMIPHHQGAIDMALAELRYGKDERLKRLAQEIIVDQQQEIAVMHLALGEPLPPGTPAPTQVGP